MSKKRITFNLSNPEMEQLESIVRSKTAEQRMVTRSKIILMTEEGKTLDEISGKLDISRVTANHWRRRYLLRRMEGLKDEPRSGRPWTFSSEDRLKVIAHSFKNAKDATPFSNRKLASTLERENLKISKSTVQRILSNTGLKPHRIEKWLTSKEPEFESKITQVVGLYMNPPENAFVICADKETNLQESGKKTSGKPMKSGTQALIASLIFDSEKNTKKGDFKHQGYEFLDFLKEIIHKHPNQELYFIMDNINKSLKTKKITEWGGKQGGHIKFHFAPTHESWLNQIGFCFTLFARKFPKRNIFDSVDDMAGKITMLLENFNKNTGSFKWISTS